MTNIFNLFVLSNTLLILLFQPCSCSCKRNDSVTYIKEDLKNYTLFQSSSFWIYQKQPLGLLDTVTLISSERENIQNEYCQPAFERFSGIEYSSLSGDSIFISSDNINNLDALLRRQSSDNQYAYFSGNINDSIAKIEGSMKYTSFLPTYSQQNLVFNKVKIFTKRAFLNNPTDSLVKLFWAESVGVIRKEFAGGSYDELIKFQVTQ